MSGLALLLFSVAAFILGYLFYLKFLLKRAFPISLDTPTPAVELNDGFDYVPARNWLMLFGHHFASIAGAAPIIGPVIALSLWGWAPAIIWIVLGSIFLGGIHDFSSLYVSMKSKGGSMAEVSKIAVSSKTKNLFSVFILLTLILVIGVFLYFCADTLMNKPEVIIPSFGLIPVAVLVGIMLYRFNMNIFFSTLLGLLLLGALIYFGDKMSFAVPIGNEGWIIILICYCFIASVIPVNILLQPRDYLSTYLLFAGIIFGVLGIFITRPVIEAPAFTAFNTESGFLWPMLFVTVACGAISGFHSLVAAGTTSKQISSERYAPRIGYGAMLLEGLLAVIALVSVASLSGDTFSKLFKSSGAINCFGHGYGNIVFPFLGSYGAAFAILILNTFILTTLDTATRISRYVMTEVFNLKSKLIATLIPVILAGLLAISGSWRAIWVIFGAGNQLIAALSLIVVSGWLIKRERPIKYTFIPAIFMLTTAVFAILYKLNQFVKDRNIVLSIISVMLILLGISVSWEARFIFKRFIFRKRMV
ncbi:MAG: carbon starvation protein A [Candidatus Kaelpia imicola]|nr:carbon starvation protein A [Candidatus Kaelpia imicola]